jgi:PAS domain S-box-containing protein
MCAVTSERITLDYRAILDQAPVGIVVYDRDLRVLECNEKWAEMVRASREDIVGLHIDELRDQRHRVALLGALDGVTLAYESPYQATASEAWLWLRATFGPLRNANGDISGVIVTASLDRPTGVIGESIAQSSAETRLDETQRFGRIGSWTWDAKRRSVGGSPEFYSILGRGSDATAAPLDDYKSLIHPEDLARSLTQLEHAIQQRLPVITLEFRLLLPDGTIRWVAVRAQGVFSGGQLLSAWGLVQDVTERRLLEDQLRQSQKMEAMGQLAAGVAHDFNNLLTVIKIESEILTREVNASPGMQAGVRGIRGAADRAADLTKQLLAFSRKQLIRPRLLDVNDTVAGANQLLRRLIGEDVELVTDLAPHLPPVLADAGQLTQVLMNLAVNARDAMPTGGKLSIATGSELIRDVRNEHNLPPGEYVKIVVTDTGHGMNEATLRRIFEPFFTTKAPGHGTGLGLSTVYGIIDQLGGHITVASEPDQGATFAMYFLPQPVEAEVPRDPQPRSNGRPGPSAGATVLLVEDEPGVRAVCHRVLAREGHRVLLAENGHDALFAAETFPGHIDLLLTDMVLPKLNGRELYDRLREKHEDLRVLYMSGYTDDEMVRRGLIDQCAKVLEKPFAVTDLVAAVHDVLGNTLPNER